MYLISLHPEDGNIFFYSRNHEGEKKAQLYKYQVGKDNFEKVFDVLNMKEWPHKNTQVLTLVHPWLPTKIPDVPFN